MRSLVGCDDLLVGWMAASRRVRSARTGRMSRTSLDGGLRFAFYGRMSTDDFQDLASSRQWQRTAAEDLIAGHGRVVLEYFDVGCSRRRPWRDRPQAAALLAAVADPDRGFDAIVVGEYERGFYGEQLANLAPVLAGHGVQLWLPEAGGPFDHRQPAHQALTMLLGAQARREVLRARFRTTAAMAAQAREQGRYLGGRPPYGYRLVDAGPHPNAVHAGWGRRLQRLDPDPATAPIVRWIFDRRLAGHSAASVARTLNQAGVPCPSAADPDRNRHRDGKEWTLRTVAAILANPRYTGRQVWNRQRTDHATRDADLGPCRVQRWNTTEQWVVSQQIAHPAIVSEDDFVAAQRVNANPTPAEGGTRTYLLVGLVRCGLCGRRMHSHWLRGRPAYRCRHGHTSAHPRPRGRPRNLYLREDRILARVGVDLRGEVPGEPAEIAEHIRQRGITIICRQDSCTLNTDIEATQPMLINA